MSCHVVSYPSLLHATIPSRPLVRSKETFTGPLLRQAQAAVGLIRPAGKAASAPVRFGPLSWTIGFLASTIGGPCLPFTEDTWWPKSWKGRRFWSRPPDMTPSGRPEILKADCILMARANCDVNKYKG